MRQFEENTNAYINAVCKEIRWKKVHEPVKRELLAHIEDQSAAFIASGKSESEAEARAVAEMGDPVTAGMMGLLMSLFCTDGLYTDSAAKSIPKLKIRLEWEG